MRERTSYPYEPGRFGIPLETYPVGFRGEFESGSGRKLKIAIGHSAVRIVDKEDVVNFDMSAYIESPGTLEMSLFTRSFETGERHPDMFAARFLDFAIAHFEASGHVIGTFVDMWLKRSDNTAEYMASLKKGHSKEESAANTWTGRNLARHGFSVSKVGKGPPIPIEFSRQT